VRCALNRAFRWLVALVGTAVSFWGALLLSEVFDLFPFWPRSDSDRWNVGAVFAGSVSAAVLAGLVWWASRPQEQGGESEGEAGSFSINQRTFSGAFRASALTIGSAANFIVSLNAIERSLNVELWEIMVIAVAQTVLSLYLANVMGVTLRRSGVVSRGVLASSGLFTAVICGITWAGIGVSVAFAFGEAFSSDSGLVTNGSATTARLAATSVVNELIAILLYVGSGIVMALGLPIVRSDDNEGRQ
jgi:hypothetical protein